jgi:hypothetical protein
MAFLKRFSDNNVTTLTDVATIAIDMSSGAHFQLTLGGNRTLGNPTNAGSVKEVWIAIKQDATGGRTLAFSSDWIAVDSTVTLDPAANAVTIVYATSRDFGSGIKWYYTVEHAAETGGGGGLTKHQLAGGTDSATGALQTEVVVGGFHFDPTLYTGETVTLRLVGDFSTTDGSATAQLRLYDIGANASFNPVRRSTVSIAFANVDVRMKVDQVLSMVASPGTNINEIHNVARNYELRIYLDTAISGSSMRAAWSGILIS